MEFNIINDKKIMKKLYECFVESESSIVSFNDRNRFYANVMNAKTDKQFNINKSIDLQLENSLKKIFLENFNFGNPYFDGSIINDYLDNYSEIPFNSISDIFNVVMNYIERLIPENYKNIYVEYINDCMMSEDNTWCYYDIKKLIEVEKKEEVKHRLYLNLDGDETRVFAKFFIEECLNNKIPYNFKLSKYKRDDSVVIYARNQYDIEVYLKIIKKFKENFPHIKFMDIPLLTLEIASYVGYGQDPVDKSVSYNSLRCSFLHNIFKYAIATTLFKVTYGQYSKKYKDFSLEEIKSMLLDIPFFNNTLQEVLVENEYDIDIDNFAVNKSGNSIDFDNLNSQNIRK